MPEGGGGGEKNVYREYLFAVPFTGKQHAILNYK